MRIVGEGVCYLCVRKMRFAILHLSYESNLVTKLLFSPFRFVPVPPGPVPAQRGHRKAQALRTAGVG